MGHVAVHQAKDGKYRRRSIPKSNPNPNFNRSGGQKRSPGQNHTTTVDNPSPAKGLVMEKVQILKRGEVLDDKPNMNISTLLKVDDDKSKSLGKVGGRRRAMLKKDKKKVKVESVVKKVVVEMKDEKKEKLDGDEKIEVESKKENLVQSSTDRLGPGPEMMPNLSDFNGGSGFVDSPSPSSLPLPAFFTKKSDPTMNLIRMLRRDYIILYSRRNQYMVDEIIHRFETKGFSLKDISDLLNGSG